MQQWGLRNRFEQRVLLWRHLTGRLTQGLVDQADGELEAGQFL